MVEATGFKKAERTGIVLQVNQTARMEVTMEVGAITETVEMRAGGSSRGLAAFAGGQDQRARGSRPDALVVVDGY